MIFIKTSALNPFGREIISYNSYESLIDFLVDVYPDGFKRTVDIFINTDQIYIEDYDTKLKDDDIIVLIERPAAAFFGISGFWAWVINTAASIALNYALNAIFAPEAPNRAQNNSASPVYNLNNTQNEAKIGQPIPVIYGTVRSYPSIIAQPYFQYYANQQYLYHCLCVGHGSFSLNKLFIDDFDVTDNEDVAYKLLNRGDFYDIESAVGDANYIHITNTLITPSELEIKGVKSSSANMRLQKDKKLIVYDNNPFGITPGDILVLSVTEYNEETEPGFYCIYSSFWLGFTVVDIITVGDVTTITLPENYTTNQCNEHTFFTFNNVPYSTTVETQKYTFTNEAKFVEFDYTYPQGLFRFDSVGNVIKGIDSFRYRIYDIDTGVVLFSEIITSQSNTLDVVRKTKRVDVSSYSSSNLGISFQKITPSSSSTNFQNKMFIERVKELYGSESHYDYGDITLLWVRLKATNAISSAGQTRVNGFFTRTDINNDLNSVLSDIYTNINYGARLNSLDLDFAPTAETVNISIDQIQTVWDVMKQISKAQKYSIYPVGQNIALKKDDINDIVTGLYNETNILRNTIKADYFFKEEAEEYDGYRVTYMDADMWVSSSYTYPTISLNPKSLELVGVTSPSKAQEMATYLWKQEQSRRKIITFDTDIQGLVPQYLDKIKISHSALNWGTAGEIIRIDGQNIELSDPIVDLSAVGITLRKNDGSVSDPLSISVTNKYNIIMLEEIPSWVAVGTFYTVGKTEEFLVTKIKPQGDTVSVECVAYDEEIYD